MNVWNFLLDIVVLLASAMVVGAIFARLGQNPLVGYILAGMFLAGPGSLGVVGSEKPIEAIAELGVTLLLFSLGLEFSWDDLKRFGRRALLGGVLQIVLTLVAFAMLAMLLGVGLREAIAIGAMFAVSSTACVLRILFDRGEIDSAHGRHSVAILLTQDAAIVPLAILITILGGRGTVPEVALDVVQIVLAAAGLILLLYLLVNKLAVRALWVLTTERNRELAILLAVVIGLGSAWAAHRVGVSPALGAFVAGMLLGSSPFALQVRADISSLRVILLTLFFGSAGMIANPVWIFQNLPLVASVTLILVLGKSLIVWLVLRSLGQLSVVSASAGLCLAQIGEFAFVLGNIGQEAGVVSESTNMLIISSAIVSLFLTPYLVGSAPTIALRVLSFLGLVEVAMREELKEKRVLPKIIVIGYGTTAQVATANFLRQQEEVLVIDLNRELIGQASERGFSTRIGDASDINIWEHLPLSKVRLVLITIPNRSTSLTVLAHVRRLIPSATVAVRSRYHRDEADFANAGADIVVGDESEVGTELARRLESFQ